MSNILKNFSIYILDCPCIKSGIIRRLSLFFQLLGTIVMIQRMIKGFILITIASFTTLVSLGNIIDYDTNFWFISRVVSMDTLDANPTIHWRAIESPFLQHCIYLFIIVVESISAILCWIGALICLRNLNNKASFFSGKQLGICGTALFYLLLGFGFLTLGNEWFASWQSKSFDLKAFTHPMVTFIGISLLILMLPEQDSSA